MKFTDKYVDMRKEIESVIRMILTKNYLFYKTIFSLMGFLAIGITYILIFHLNWVQELDIFKLVFISFGISSAFVFSGFMLLIDTLIATKGIKKLGKESLRDFSVVFVFFSAIITYIGCLIGAYITVFSEYYFWVIYIMILIIYGGLLFYDVVIKKNKSSE